MDPVSWYVSVSWYIYGPVCIERTTIIAIVIHSILGPTPRAFRSSRPPSAANSTRPTPDFIQQLEGESEMAYFKRLQQTASDPMAFENGLGRTER
jgi:hypothetical protein